VKTLVGALLLISCASARSVVSVPLSGVSYEHRVKTTLVFSDPAGYEIAAPRFTGPHETEWVISKGRGTISRMVVTTGMRRDRHFPTGDLSKGSLLGSDVVWRSYRGGPLYRDGPYIELVELEGVLEQLTCISELAGVRLYLLTDDPRHLPELRAIAQSMALRDPEPCREAAVQK